MGARDEASRNLSRQSRLLGGRVHRPSWLREPRQDEGRSHTKYSGSHSRLPCSSSGRRIACPGARFAVLAVPVRVTYLSFPAKTTSRRWKSEERVLLDQ